jgi:hypothetical protein
MSERITWEPCPCCARPAAVGWGPVLGPDGQPAGERAVEFDCPAGCRLGAAELRHLSRRHAGGATDTGPSATGPMHPC